MKQKIIHTIFTRCMLVVATAALSACNDELHVRETFPFKVETMPVPKEIKQGQTVDIRCTLSSEGNFSGTRYTIRYFQHEGEEGILRLSKWGTVFSPNDRYQLELEEGHFSLYYTPISEGRQMIEVVIEDNFGQSQTLTFDFNSKAEDVKSVHRKEVTDEIQQKYRLIPNSPLVGVADINRRNIKRRTSLNERPSKINCYEEKQKMM